MRMTSKAAASRLSVLFVAAALVAAQGADLYVSTQGSDSNPGTSTQPFRTITRAYSAAAAGTTIIVLPGVYTDYQSGWGLHLTKAGTAANPIVLRSQVRGGAIIDGQYGSDRNKTIYLDGSYHVIDGFQIKGGPHHGIFITGNFNHILNNEIHHNGNISMKPAGEPPGGGQGAYSSVDASGNKYVGNYIHENGLAGSNLDHGLYLCGDNEIVANNVIINNASFGIHVAGYNGVNNLKIYNNVVAYHGRSGIVLWMTVNGVDIRFKPDRGCGPLLSCILSRRGRIAMEECRNRSGDQLLFVLRQ